MSDTTGNLIAKKCEKDNEIEKKFDPSMDNYSRA